MRPSSAAVDDEMYPVAELVARWAFFGHIADDRHVFQPVTVNGVVGRHCTIPYSARHISAFPVAPRRSYDLVAQAALAAPQSPEIFLEDVQDVVLVASRLAGGMGRDKDVRHRPERRCRREWLLDRDIDSRPRNGTDRQPPAQRDLVDAAPAGNIDQKCRSLHEAERVPIDEIFC